MKKIVFTSLVFLFSLLSAQSQEMKQKLEMRIDSLGDARIIASMTMNASQWQGFIQTEGNNPALMKRSMERALPGYFLDNFEMKKNDMERSFEFSFKAYGVCQVNKKGKWIVNTEQKNPDITSLTDHKYMMVINDEETKIQITQFIEFPKNAKNIILSKDAFEKAQFEFDMNTSGATNAFPFWAGIALALIGAVWAGIIAFFKKPKTT